MEELCGPRSFVSLMAQRHRCAIFTFGGYLRMTTSKLFTTPIPEPDKAPWPPTHGPRPEYKPGRPILLPTKPKAAFQWPPDCLWPFHERTGNPRWYGDA